MKPSGGGILEKTAGMASNSRKGKMHARVHDWRFCKLLSLGRNNPQRCEPKAMPPTKPCKVDF
jgi:hypothetical protein